MMQNHTGHVSMDPDFQALRITMQDRICKWLEKRQPNQSSEWKQRLPEIAKKLEESIFKESMNKEDYISKFQTNIEMRIANMLTQMKENQIRQHQLQQQQNHQQTMAHHNLLSNSSASGLMIPTPGINHNSTGTMRMSSTMENNQGINTTSGLAGFDMSKGTNQATPTDESLHTFIEAEFRRVHDRLDEIQQQQQENSVLLRAVRGRLDDFEQGMSNIYMSLDEIGQQLGELKDAWEEQQRDPFAVQNRLNEMDQALSLVQTAAQHQGTLGHMQDQRLSQMEARVSSLEQRRCRLPGEGPSDYGRSGQ